MLNPGRNSGFDSTNPTSRLRATTGVSAVVPSAFCRIVIEVLLNGLVKLGTVVDTGAANSSDRLGAHTSRENTALRRNGSYGVSHVLPIFQKKTQPNNEKTDHRPATLRFALPSEP